MAKLAVGEDPDATVAPTRTFTITEVTSSHPDDTRRPHERAEARRLREVRARVKAARAAVSSAPGLSDAVAGDWQRVARFYVRFRVSEQGFRFRVPADRV